MGKIDGGIGRGLLGQSGLGRCGGGGEGLPTYANAEALSRPPIKYSETLL